MNSAKLKLLTIVVAAVFILRLTQTFTSSSISMENTAQFSKNMMDLRLLEQARKEIEQLRNEQRTKDWKFPIVVFVGHRVEVIRRTLKALSKAKRLPRSTPCIFVLDIKAGQEKEFQEVQSDGVIFSLRILLASHSSRAAF